MKSRIVLYGAGALARECCEIVGRMARAGHDVACAGFLIDETFAGPPTLLGLPVVRRSGALDHGSGLSYCIAIGDGAARLRVAAELSAKGATFATLVDPQVWIAGSSTIGEGSILFGHSSVSVDSRLGRHVLVNPGCTLAHDNEIADGCSLGPGVDLAGRVACGEGSAIGTGAAIRPGIRIGAFATIGAGSVVVRDVASHQIVAGNPARPLRRKIP